MDTLVGMSSATTTHIIGVLRPQQTLIIHHKRVTSRHTLLIDFLPGVIAQERRDGRMGCQYNDEDTPGKDIPET